MKFLLTASMFISTSIALACPNLTGTYRDNQGSITEFIQNGCESIKVIAANQPEAELLTDGVVREIFNQTIDANGIEVKVQVTLQATFTANELVVNTLERAEAQGQISESSAQSIVTLLSNGDMQTITTTSYGQVTTAIETKIN
jgi:hypothetical protein